MSFSDLSHKNLAQAFISVTKKFSNELAYSQPNYTPMDSTKPRIWHSRSRFEVGQRVRAISSWLCNFNLKPGFRAAIFSNSRPEWMEADLGILGAGGVTTSIFPSLHPQEAAYILYDSESKIIFVENQEQANKIISAIEEKINIPTHKDRKEKNATITIDKIICFEDCSPHALIVHLSELLNADPIPEREFGKGRRKEDIAALVYTSGTTGVPKGVMQSHGNYLANIRQTYASKLIQGGDDFMIVLPLAHSFAKLMGLIGFLTPVPLKFAAICNKQTSSIKPPSITKDMKEGSASIVPLVPRLYEKIQDKIIQKTKSKNLQGMILNLAIKSAIKKNTDKNINFINYITYYMTTSIRTKIKKSVFGPKFRCGISGGAKLPINTAKFFAALGFEICEGYGLTETCVATNINRPGKQKIGTVGPALDSDIEIKIAQDREILFRGPNIALGYLGMPSATSDSWDQDGWFHTGDLGTLDKDGFLSVIGRKKAIIVPTSGKNIVPHTIEDLITEVPFISQAVVVGDNKPWLVALVSIDLDIFKDYIDKNHNNTTNLEFYLNGSDHLLVWQAVKEKVSHLPHYKQVRSIGILPEHLTVENSYLTPTMKIKRLKVIKDFAPLIDQLYLWTEDNKN